MIDPFSPGRAASPFTITIREFPLTFRPFDGIYFPEPAEEFD